MGNNNWKFWSFIHWKDDCSICRLLVHFASEVMGTFILMYIGCLSCVSGLGAPHRTTLEAGLGWGLAVLMAVQIAGHLSGAHINPVVTITSMMLGRTPVLHTLIYIPAQILGSTAGTAVARACIDEILYKTERICSPGVGPKVTELEGFIVEIVVTSILSLVCCGVWDGRNAHNTDSIPLKFGFIVGGLVTSTAPYTGCHMNPARTLGPVLVNGHYTNLWIYFVGPLLAAFLIPILYRLIFMGDSQSESETNLDK